MPLQVFKKFVPTHVPVARTVDKFINQMVYWHAEDGQRLAGRVERKSDGAGYHIRLAVPNDGQFIVTETDAVVDGKCLTIFETVSNEGKVRWFETTSALDSREDAVKMVKVEDENKRVIDYQDVSFAGFASTFKGYTPADRDGDYVAEGAFSKTIKDFMRNPVMLIDHRNSVEYLAGSYSKINQTNDGLVVEGRISNSPDLRNVRFLIAEKHLRTLSMGGLFYYGADGHEIKEVNLMEVSLTPVPANQDAIFTLKDVSLDTVTKCYKHFHQAGRNIWQKKSA